MTMLNERQQLSYIAAQAADDIAMPTTVSLLEPLGAETLVTLKFGASTGAKNSMRLAGPGTGAVPAAFALYRMRIQPDGYPPGVKGVIIDVKFGVLP